jgi:poly(A) polymerase
MAASEQAKPVSRREDALTIVHRLVQAGYVAYFAGGCVRDMLLGHDPKDYDVATNATPDKIKQLFPRAQGVGQAFGVLLVREGKSIIELATFRADGSYTDGRRPDEVQFASAEQDAKRRDFTINGLFFDPLLDKLIDYVGGSADLREHTLRAIGGPAQRFAEDYLRMLRAARFAARFGLKIDPATAQAIRENAHKLPRIAPERICDELRAMFHPPTRIIARGHLDALGLTPVLLRHLLEGKDASGSHASALFETVGGGVELSFPLALVAYTLDRLIDAGETVDRLLSSDSVHRILQALRTTLRLSNDDSASIDHILDVAPILHGPMPGVAALKRFAARADSADARQLLRAIARAGSFAPRITQLEAAWNAFPPDSIAPPPLLNGNDLQQAGFTPGPKFKPALDAAYDAQLEGRATTHEAALHVARAMLDAGR